MQDLCETLTLVVWAIDGKNDRTCVLDCILPLLLKLVKSSDISRKKLGVSLLGIMAQQKGDEKLYFGNVGNFAQKIVEQKFIEDIFAENPQAEVIEKARDLIIYLVDKKQFQHSYIKLLWKYCMDKQEVISKNSLAIMSNIVNSFSEKVKYNILF